ncbi:uncharacterized protein LOC119366091 [Triticum dicoccoides]|uniref:uncharacterized protein LOC119366091 n=1 Tax=Triticum dicoccoides TaxID=85692 RepID=UPI00162D7D33|nr:uncharacterized protein LOC119366091 [Triticum dicoccoides]
MDGKTEMLLPRPVTVAKKKIPGSVWLVCGWALLSACAIALGHYDLPCRQATFVLRCGCVELTDTKAACLSALWIGALLCTASQAAAAALALLLPRLHPELLSLSLWLAATGHCMASGAVFILCFAEPCPGCCFHSTLFHLALCLLELGDVVGSMALVVGAVRSKAHSM